MPRLVGKSAPLLPFKPRDQSRKPKDWKEAVRFALGSKRRNLSKARAGKHSWFSEKGIWQINYK